MSEKKYDTTITDMPSPPRSRPTSARQIDQRVRHAAAFHDGAGEDEAQDRQQYQFCDAPIRLEASISSE